ncbi:MAG: hypothetical protein K1X67_26090 [Fimbriimonadaceae bacterium]|nr:hypothetical protein [Fimbriimonadaceae bacterium]
MGSSQLIGKRTRGLIDPVTTLAAADEALAKLAASKPQAVEDFRTLKYRYARECRSYYSVAALSRRALLEDELRSAAYAKLFRLRSNLENSIIGDLDFCGERGDLEKIWASKSFFGVSAKQGVSIRYALASCVPTRDCGARCYAHDGRDREIHHLFRGALNYYFGQKYETSAADERRRLLGLLSNAVAYGVSAARSDQLAAQRELGILRAPRIRFSHVGEIASTPEFANAVALQVRSIDPEVACVIYTRHPKAQSLDSRMFVINFTLEGDDDPRRRWIPPTARIVSSAWNGQLSSLADINFLEHHVAGVAQATGRGAICPVTLDHARNSSCDVAQCQLCFVPPAEGLPR